MKCLCQLLGELISLSLFGEIDDLSFRARIAVRWNAADGVILD